MRQDHIQTVVPGVIPSGFFRGTIEVGNFTRRQSKTNLPRGTGFKNAQE